jgi:uncharacterized damage-inducible protein DinB
MVACLSLQAQNQFQNEASGTLAFYSDRIMPLADAVPADKYSWSPEEGVRTFGEVLAHVVSANYFFAMKMGAVIPETVDMMGIEKNLKTKEQLKTALQDSYKVVIDVVKNSSKADLEEKVEFPFPGEFTSMSAALIAVSHSSEHMGQLIAYCRTNGITPPWSVTDEGGQD